MEKHWDPRKRGWKAIFFEYQLSFKNRTKKFFDKAEKYHWEF